MFGVNERMGLKLFGIGREIQTYVITIPKRLGQTDGQTTCNLITALCVASRGKNSLYLSHLFLFLLLARGIWTLGEFGHSLCLLKLLTHFYCHIHNL